MKTIQTEWTGIRPLIMNNPQTVDIANPYSRASRDINSRLKKARKKEDEAILVELSEKMKRNDFEATSYFSDGRFYVPDHMLLAVIKAGATAQRKGKDIDRAVIIEETEAIVEGIPEVASLAAAYESGQFCLVTPCRIPPKTGALTMKARCMLPTGWRLKFSITFDDEIITEGTMKESMTYAGRYCGIGAWAPRFGRFLVK